MTRSGNDLPPMLCAQTIPVPGLWCVHSYYSLNPWAPDGRLLLAGCDRATGRTWALVLSPQGRELARLAGPQAYESFWHTGLWQSWSRDGARVYLQAGNLREPVIERHDLASGAVARMPGFMEGCHGEPILSAQLGLLYAAGYGTGIYNPSLAPVPFQNRDAHGLFRYDLDRRSETLVLSVNQALARHPQRDRLRELDAAVRRRLGGHEGLTLMLYCVRWNRQGTRALFYFGNHCVVKERGEPRLSCVFTIDHTLTDLRLAIDLSAPRCGVHWSWHPDGERLIGYGPDPADEQRMCLATVRYDGSDYRKISAHASGGHPTISPADEHLAVTDESSIPGRIVFLDLRSDRIVATASPGRVLGEKEAPGRNPLRVCHHPVFRPDGKQVLVNALAGPDAQVCLLDAPVLP